MTLAFRRLLAALTFLLLAGQSPAQPVNNDPLKPEPKPYKVLSSGKQFTVKSAKTISHVMVWTAGGDRIVEQKNIQQTSFSFTIPVKGSFYFLMVGMGNGKIYTEKIGVHD
jgi:hypothetical protein